MWYHMLSQDQKRNVVIIERDRGEGLFPNQYILERLGYPVSDIEIRLAYHLLCRSRSRCWNIVSKVGLCRQDKYLLNACVYSPCLACGYAQCINLARSYAVRYLQDTSSLCRVMRTAQTRAMWETMTSTHSMVTSSSPIPFPLSEIG